MLREAWLSRKDASGRSFTYHCGSVKGFNSCLVNYTDEDLVVAVLTNSEQTGGYRHPQALAEFFRSHEGGQ